MTNNNWNESDHPRDNEGKFTFKGLGETSSESNEEKMQRRADILFPNTQEKTGTFTGGATSIKQTVSDEIAGVKKGEPMSFEEAGKGVNPNFSYWGNTTLNTNCQSCVAIFEARLRGFDIEASLLKDNESVEIKEKLEIYPNIAYIDSKTGKVPQFIILKVSNKSEFENILNSQIKKGERYILSFNWKRANPYNNDMGFGHIITVMKNENDILVFYDPQINKIYNQNIFFSRIKFNYTHFEEKLYPKILRVDDKELNYKILSKISCKSKKRNFK